LLDLSVNMRASVLGCQSWRPLMGFFHSFPF